MTNKQDGDRRTNRQNGDRRTEDEDRLRRSEKEDRQKSRNGRDSTFDLRKTISSRSKVEVERERNSKDRRAETNRQRHDSVRSVDNERKRRDSTRSESDSVTSSSTQNNKKFVEKEKSKNVQNTKDVRTRQGLDAAPDTNRKVTPTRPDDVCDQEAVVSITNDNLEEGEEEEGEIPDSDDETADEPKNVPSHENKDRRSHRKEKKKLLRDSNCQDVEGTMEQIFSSPTFDDVLAGKSSAEVLTGKSSASSQSTTAPKLPSHDENEIVGEKKSSDSEAISELETKPSDVQERPEPVESKPVEPESVLDEEEVLISSSGSVQFCPV